MEVGVEEETEAVGEMVGRGPALTKGRTSPRKEENLTLDASLALGSGKEPQSGLALWTLGTKI